MIRFEFVEDAKHTVRAHAILSGNAGPFGYLNMWSSQFFSCKGKCRIHSFLQCSGPIKNVHAGAQQDLIGKGLKRAAQFSWQKAAEQTLEVYHKIGRE